MSSKSITGLMPCSTNGSSPEFINPKVNTITSNRYDNNNIDFLDKDMDYNSSNGVNFDMNKDNDNANSSFLVKLNGTTLTDIDTNGVNLLQGVYKKGGTELKDVVETLTNKIISGATNTISNIPNSALSGVVLTSTDQQISGIKTFLNNFTAKQIDSFNPNSNGISTILLNNDDINIEATHDVIIESNQGNTTAKSIKFQDGNTLRALIDSNGVDVKVGEFRKGGTDLKSVAEILTNKTIESNTNSVGDLCLSSNVPLKNGTNTFSAVNTFSQAPVIAEITNTGTLTLPTSTDTLVGKSTTDIFTNKTITSATNSVGDDCLSSNVPLKNGTNTFSAVNTFTNNIIANDKISIGTTNIPTNADLMILDSTSPAIYLLDNYDGGASTYRGACLFGVKDGDESTFNIGMSSHTNTGGSNRDDPMTNIRFTIRGENGRVGIGMTNPSQLLDVAGNVASNGTILSSDDRIKKNEIPIENATETLLKLKPQFYDKYLDMSSNEAFSQESGLISQEVWYNAPELRHLVSCGDASQNPIEMDLSNVDIQNDPDYASHGWSETEPSSLNYVGLIAYLIKSNQELHERISKNEKEIDDLQESILGLMD